MDDKQLLLEQIDYEIYKIMEAIKKEDNYTVKRFLQGKLMGIQETKLLIKQYIK